MSRGSPRVLTFSRDRAYLGRPKLFWPLAIAWNVADGVEELYVADPDNQVVHKVDMEGRATLFAGFPRDDQSSEKEQAPAYAKFTSPTGITVGRRTTGAGPSASTVVTIYVSDDTDHTIRKIDSKGTVSLLAGRVNEPGCVDGVEGRFNRPYGVVSDRRGEYLYMCDRENHMVRRVTTSNGAIESMCGNPDVAMLRDGIGTAATFKTPESLAIDYEGRCLFVADNKVNVIRKVIIETREVSTLAGGVLQGFFDGEGHRAKFNGPWGVAIDRFGIVVTADCHNHVIRRISPTGEATTLIGIPERKGVEDGDRTRATFRWPTGIALHPVTGDLYVCDGGNSSIRVIKSTGLMGWYQSDYQQRSLPAPVAPTSSNHTNASQASQSQQSQPQPMEIAKLATNGAPRPPPIPTTRPGYTPTAQSTTTTSTRDDDAPPSKRRKTNDDDGATSPAPRRRRERERSASGSPSPSRRSRVTARASRSRSPKSRSRSRSASPSRSPSPRKGKRRPDVMTMTVDDLRREVEDSWADLDDAQARFERIREKYEASAKNERELDRKRRKLKDRIRELEEAIDDEIELSDKYKEARDRYYDERASLREELSEVVERLRSVEEKAKRQEDQFRPGQERIIYLEDQLNHATRHIEGLERQLHQANEKVSKFETLLHQLRNL